MILQGKIEKLAFGGKGILRDSTGMVVFIPFTAPGDVIEYRVTRQKKNYAEGEIVKIISPSVDRTTPLCPYFGTCGGCQLQHLQYTAQLAYKKNAVSDALRGLYHDEIEITAADPIWNYRRHITLTLEPALKGFSAGYIAIDNKTLLQVKQCPIFTTERKIFELIDELTSLLDSSETRSAKVKIIKSDTNKYILSFHFDKMPSNFGAVKGYIDGKHIQAILGASIKLSHVFGDPIFNIDVNGEKFITHPHAFAQNHAKQSQNIYSEIQRTVKNLRPKRMLDLYSGIGISSLLSAPFAEEIDAVEWNKKSTDLGILNGKMKGISNISFQANDVQLALGRLLSKNHELAVVNPPRIGLDQKIVKELGSSKLKELIYISCQPATLARDLRLLQEFGFKVKHVHAFDMFPQTGHVETMTNLSRLSF